ncbi:two-component system response regulator FixJ [Novosphingobium hassiacum]|uniref:Two-component system response regulator FixJ n=1 Tax=Novosphingobium hassiacum TaxID=173676 RepID=A0A7W6EXN6_9SPHN|nr:response regulator [Novosphingobium hassiacum]MBB3862577.1 two-component system response regulator FixJ [Novosphingobium hassiacum]
MSDKGLVHIVDDDDTVRRSLDFLLSTSGYRALRWTGGEQFLKGADNSVPACVLLDIRMPGLDGLETQRKMPELGFDFPVIVLTGHGDVSTAVEAMHAGAADFLSKPFDREQLLKSVAIAFQQLADRSMADKRSRWAQAQIGKLTERERVVLDGLACGFPNKTIAYDLGISSRTVEVYRANVMTKLGVTNFADALRTAFAAGLGSAVTWRKMHQVPGGGAQHKPVEPARRHHNGTI